MKQVGKASVQLDVENIGGIDETEVSFKPGVTVLAGRNASNRTSLLQAIMAGLGSESVSLKGDAQSGSVTLEIGDETYTRTLKRENGEITFGGDPYLEDPKPAELFAFLLESNEARRGVSLGADLREIIMEPVDVDKIEADIDRLRSEKEEVERKIENRESLQSRRTELEQRRVDLESDIEETESKLEEKRADLEEITLETKEAKAEESELDRKMRTVQQKRSDLEDIKFKLDNQRESLESIEAEIGDVREEFEDLEDVQADEKDRIETELNRLREENRQLKSEMSKLQSVIQFNEEMLENSHDELTNHLHHSQTNGGVTDQLLEDDNTTTCWTCGSEIDIDRIEETLDTLRDLRQSKFSEQDAVEEQVRDLQEEKSTIDSRQNRKQSLERQIDTLEREREERKASIENLGNEKEALEADIEELEAEIAELEAQDRSEVLEVHREVNELELELKRLRNDRKQVESEIEEIDTKTDEIADLETEREQIQEELTERRERIERLETDTIDAFNEHMETVLELLDFSNIERIWVERVEDEIRQGRSKVSQPGFRLHVVRSSTDGVTYRDDFEHLSESEREVTGLIFALAGYLAHDVYDEVPIILLDSLEAIDSDRIATLVDYLEEYSEYLVAALLPEDAQALDTDYERVTDI